MDTYRISIVRSSTSEYMEEGALLHALRPHLNFQEVSHETYVHLRGALPKDAVMIVEYQRNENDFVDLDIGRALADYKTEQRQASERVERGTTRKSSTTKKKAVKKVKKGLTARQVKELESLRKEVGNA